MCTSLNILWHQVQSTLGKKECSIWACQSYPSANHLKRPNGPTVNLLQYVGQWNHLEVVTPNRLHIPWPAKLHMPQTHEFWTRCSSPSTWCWLASSMVHFRNYNSSYTSYPQLPTCSSRSRHEFVLLVLRSSLYRALNLGLFQILENDPLIVHLWWMYNVWSLYQQKIIIHNGIQFTVLTMWFFPTYGLSSPIN